MVFNENQCDALIRNFLLPFIVLILSPMVISNYLYAINSMRVIHCHWSVVREAISELRDRVPDDVASRFVTKDATGLCHIVLY